MRTVEKSQGFTLIEIVFSLIILSVLGTLAAQHYFDLREESEKKLAKATVDAVQVKINSHFTRFMAQGYSCGEAVTMVNQLDKLSDDGSFNFGDFTLSIVGDEIPVASENGGAWVTAKTSNRAYTNIAQLEVPSCKVTTPPDDDITVSEDDEIINEVWWMTATKIRAKYGCDFEIANVFWGNKINLGKIVYDIFFDRYLVCSGSYIDPINLATANNPDNWVRFNYSSSEWRDTPSSGDFFLDKDKNVYIYKGNSQNPSFPTPDNHEDWIAIRS